MYPDRRESTPVGSIGNYAVLLASLILIQRQRLSIYNIPLSATQVMAAVKPTVAQDYTAVTVDITASWTTVTSVLDIM